MNQISSEDILKYRQIAQKKWQLSHEKRKQRHQKAGKVAKQ